jgi:uncharacterized protein YceH (UPF0502 family)
MELSVVQQRVVGALIEKELATPDNYPLSMNALLAACNQTTNREPVLSLTQDAVENALANLRASGCARVVYSKGMRVDKYRHVLHEVLHLEQPELALVAVLLLRGPQTAAELRARTERLHTFTSQAEVDDALQGLTHRSEPLVQLLDRQPGQKEQRWAHLLGPLPPTPSVRISDPERDRDPDRSPRERDRVAELEARVAAIEERLAAIEERLGITQPSG